MGVNRKEKLMLANTCVEEWHGVTCFLPGPYGNELCFNLITSIVFYPDKKVKSFNENTSSC